MTTLLHTLSDYTTWYHAREVFTVLALAYLVARSR
jgi:hypothetical protein